MRLRDPSRLLQISVHHIQALNILFEADILDRRIDGKKTLYSIKDPQVFELVRLVDQMALKQISQLAEAGRIIEESLSCGR